MGAVSGWSVVSGGTRLSRRLIRGRGHLLLQLLVALHHRGDDFVRQANVLQINDFVRVEIERAAGIRDVSHDDAFIHAGCISRMTWASGLVGRMFAGSALDSVELPGGSGAGCACAG